MWCEWICCCSVVPRFIWRRILRQPIGLGGAVGGAVLRANFFFGTICWWQLQAGPDTLPLLCCITDGQTPLLLDEHHTQTRTHAEGRDGFGWQFSSLSEHRGHQTNGTSASWCKHIMLLKTVAKRQAFWQISHFFWLRYQMYCITAEFWFNSGTPLHCKSEPFPLFWPSQGVVAICPLMECATPKCRVESEPIHSEFLGLRTSWLPHSL